MTDEMNETAPKQAPAYRFGLADDMLRGASEIAEFLYGDPKLRRRIYHLAETTKFPCFRIGSQLHARRSVVSKWISDQERAGLNR